MCNALGALPGALFDALTRLERLDLALNRLRGLPASIANLTALTSLDLWGNRIGVEGAQALKGLVNLTSLDLSHNNIGAEGVRAIVEHLPGLTTLNLASNNIWDEGARAIAEHLRGLTALGLAHRTGAYPASAYRVATAHRSPLVAGIAEILEPTACTPPDDPDLSGDTPEISG